MDSLSTWLIEFTYVCAISSSLLSVEIPPFSLIVSLSGKGSKPRVVIFFCVALDREQRIVVTFAVKENSCRLAYCYEEFGIENH